MITVKFFTTLRLYLRLHEIQLELTNAPTIGDLLVKIEESVLRKTSLRFMEKLLDEPGSVKMGTMILINGRNILDSDGLETLVHDGDTVSLFPPGGGG
jgi:molybdopterin synthase sulfur carrier subunit